MKVWRQREFFILEAGKKEGQSGLEAGHRGWQNPAFQTRQPRLLAHPRTTPAGLVDSEDLYDGCVRVLNFERKTPAPPLSQIGN